MNINLKIKDYIAIAIVTILSFPILYLIMLFVTGVARVEFNYGKDEDSKDKKVEFIRHTAKRDSLAAINSRTFQALQKERTEIERERTRLSEQKKRIDILQQELKTERDNLKQERKKIEKLVSQSDSLSAKKLKDLAKMYGAMRPAEAAQILETLSDKLSSQIISSINDDRQKAKILSALSKDKANRISKILAPEG